MRSRARTTSGLVAAILAIAVAACVDLAAPKGSPASISQLQLGALYIVQGDTMRDTLGVATAPSIVAYDGAGNVVTSFTPTFFITDSVQQIHFSAKGPLVAIGPADTAGATGHVVGQIAALQTGVQTIYVTVRPDTLERANTAALDSILVPFGVTLDSASSIGRVTLSTVVHGVGGRPVPGVFVRYSLETTVPSRNSSPAAYLTDDANTVFLAGQSSPDTGDASGVTGRTLVLNSNLAADQGALLQDTLVVVATALYRGAPLQGSPLRILVPVRSSFK